MQYLNYMGEKFYLNCKQLDCHMIIANANSNEGLEIKVFRKAQQDKIS